MEDTEWKVRISSGATGRPVFRHFGVATTVDILESSTLTKEKLNSSVPWGMQSTARVCTAICCLTTESAGTATDKWSSKPLHPREFEEERKNSFRPFPILAATPLRRLWLWWFSFYLFAMQLHSSLPLVTDGKCSLVRAKQCQLIRPVPLLLMQIRHLKCKAPRKMQHSLSAAGLVHYKFISFSFTGLLIITMTKWW